MPDRTTQRELDKLDALLRLIDEDGATPRGEIPPDHVAELRSMDDIDRQHVEDVVEAHANGRGPPDRAGGPK